MRRLNSSLVVGMLSMMLCGCQGAVTKDGSAGESPTPKTRTFDESGMISMSSGLVKGVFATVVTIAKEGESPLVAVAVVQHSPTASVEEVQLLHIRGSGSGRFDGDVLQVVTGSGRWVFSKAVARSDSAANEGNKL
jgi:hypothetical protein